MLNDIFRYLADEEEELVNEEAVAPAPEAPKAAEPVPAGEAQVNDEAAASKVDEKLEQEVNGETTQPDAAPQPNGTAAQEAEENQAPVPAVEAELVKGEGVPTPEPTPASEPQKTPAEKESAPAPSLPKTWANIARKSGAPAPVVPAIPVAAPKAAAPAAPSAAQPAPPPAPVAAPVAETRSQDAASNDGAGWQTAGADHKKTQSRAGEEQTVLGYIKNVTDKVDANQLKQTLSRFGKLKYFDVSRAKVRASCPVTSCES